MIDDFKIKKTKIVMNMNNFITFIMISVDYRGNFRLPKLHDKKWKIF